VVLPPPSTPIQITCCQMPIPTRARARHENLKLPSGSFGGPANDAARCFCYQHIIRRPSLSRRSGLESRFRAHEIRGGFARKEQQAQLLPSLRGVAAVHSPLVLWPKLRFYLKKAWFCGWIQHAWRWRSLAPNLTQVPNPTQRKLSLSRSSWTATISIRPQPSRNHLETVS